ncbi:MAG: hypothetical protein IPL99_12220 [Candidatus Competibacteraceae bacterium]|nr:hypothetical protein [Candidatus Competibacteraceae bacterium]
MPLIIDLRTHEVIAHIDDDELVLEIGSIAIEAPDGFTMDDMSDWFYEDGQLTHSPEQALTKARARAITRIKAEATAQIKATDWKVQRAQEREKAGWNTLEETLALLAERESIRRSSSAAEQRILLENSRSEIENFTWNVDVEVPVVRLITQKQFSDRFSDAELSRLIEISQNNPEMATWFERFHAAQDINLDAPLAQNGVWMLETAGLIAPGRAVEILS